MGPRRFCNNELAKQNSRTTGAPSVFAIEANLACTVRDILPIPVFLSDVDG